MRALRYTAGCTGSARRDEAAAGAIGDWQPDLEMLPVDTATLSAESSEVTPAAALVLNCGR